MTALVLVVILISGYLYVIRSVAARYVFKRLKGWDGYFYVASWGVLFACVAWLLTVLLSLLMDLPDWINKEIRNTVSVSDGFSNYRYLMFAVISLLLTVISGSIRKCYIRADQNRWIATLARVAAGDPLESMLILAASQHFPVLVTLESRKCYVGFASCPDFEQRTVDYIQVLPLLSGYRDKDDLTLHVTTNYEHYYRTQQSAISSVILEDFRKLIPVSDIRSISLFDSDTHHRFKTAETEPIEPDNK